MTRTLETLFGDVWGMLLRVCAYWLVYLLLGAVGALLGGGTDALVRPQPWRELLVLHLSAVLVLALVLGALRPWLRALPGAAFAGALVLPLLFAIAIPVFQPQLAFRDVTIFALAVGVPLGAIYGVVALVAHRRASRY